MSDLASAGFQAVIRAPAQKHGQPEEAELKAHHLKGGKGFRNPWESFEDHSFAFIMKNIFWRRLTGEAQVPDPKVSTLKSRVPSFLPRTPSNPSLRATWLGHACYYIEFPSSLRVLFDPVFEDHCSPGPYKPKDLKRYTQPPCQIEDLPFVDLVVISHNHYDHLSWPSVQRVLAKWKEVRWCVPLGVGAWFKSGGINESKIIELDWWEARDIEITLGRNDEEKDVEVRKSEDGAGHHASSDQSQCKTQNENRTIHATISALPSQHVTARGPWDRFKTLWCSWSVTSGGANVYFAGDTGYRSVPRLPPGTDDYAPEYENLPVCPAFKQIGEHRGPFDLGLIPIGAYEPRFVWSGAHSNPRDAVRIFKDTKCKKALGMHWGTWVLTEEGVNEPPIKLREALKAEGLEEKGVFDVIELGESREYAFGEEKGIRVSRL